VDNIVLIHGLSGSSDDMKYIADRLTDLGYSVSNINLPGHGTMPEALLTVKMDDWIRAVEKEVISFQGSSFLIGQSMGALLAMHIAESHPDRIKGVVLLSPAIKLYGAAGRLFMFLLFIYSKILPVPDVYYTKKGGSDIADSDVKRNYNAYAKVPLKTLVEFERLRKLVLKQLHQFVNPVLIVYSKNDHTISRDTVKIIDSKIGSGVKYTMIVDNSFHVLSIDRDKEKITDAIAEFLQHNRRSK